MGPSLGAFDAGDEAGGFRILNGNVGDPLVLEQGLDGGLGALLAQLHVHDGRAIPVVAPQRHGQAAQLLGESGALEGLAGVLVDVDGAHHGHLLGFWIRVVAHKQPPLAFPGAAQAGPAGAVGLGRGYMGLDRMAEARGQAGAARFFGHGGGDGGHSEAHGHLLKVTGVMPSRWARPLTGATRFLR